MATVYGVNKTLARTGTANTIEPEINGGKVRWIYDTYEAAALAAASVIELFGDKLPAEARIVDWTIDHDALADVSIKFGTSASDAVLMAFTSAAAANQLSLKDDGVDSSLGYEIAAGTGQQLIITTSGPSTATGTIKVGVAYVGKH